MLAILACSTLYSNWNIAISPFTKAAAQMSDDCAGSRRSSHTEALSTWEAIELRTAQYKRGGGASRSRGKGTGSKSRGKSRT